MITKLGIGTILAGHDVFCPGRKTGNQKGFPVLRRSCHVLLLICIMSLALLQSGRAEPTTIAFTAVIGTGNDIDTEDVFGEGYGADLAGQVIIGSASIDPTSLIELCSTGGACYADFGAGAMSVSFTLNGITSTVVSIGTLGYVGNTSGGSVLICDPSDGGTDYMSVGAASPDGMVQQSIGVLFNDATLFSAYGGGDPTVAIASLDNIGNGSDLVKGGVTFMSPVEHLDATILTIEVPEPGGLALLGIGLAGLGMVLRKTIG